MLCFLLLGGDIFICFLWTWEQIQARSKRAGFASRQDTRGASARGRWLVWLTSTLSLLIELSRGDTFPIALSACQVISIAIRIQGRTLSYNSFAYGDNKSSGDDMCTLHMARCFLVDESGSSTGKLTLDRSVSTQYEIGCVIRKRQFKRTEFGFMYWTCRK